MMTGLIKTKKKSWLIIQAKMWEDRALSTSSTSHTLYCGKNNHIANGYQIHLNTIVVHCNNLNGFWITMPFIKP